MALAAVNFLLPNTIGRSFLLSEDPCHWWRIPDIATPLASVSRIHFPSEPGCAKAVASFIATFILLKGCCCSILGVS